MVQLLWQIVGQFLKKLKIDLPRDPAIPLLGMYPKALKAILSIFCKPMFTAAKIWKQPKCPSTDKRKSKMGSRHMTECYSALKRKETPPRATALMNLEDIMTNEIHQTRKDDYCVIPLTRGPLRSQIHRDRKKKVAVTGWRRGNGELVLHGSLPLHRMKSALGWMVVMAVYTTTELHT